MQVAVLKVGNPPEVLTELDTELDLSKGHSPKSRRVKIAQGERVQIEMLIDGEVVDTSRIYKP